MKWDFRMVVLIVDLS